MNRTFLAFVLFLFSQSLMAAPLCGPEVPCASNATGTCSKRQNPATVMTNGCGGGGMFNFILSTATAIGRGIDFGNACDAHDSCYGVCGGTAMQGSCDLTFLNQMNNYCNSSFSPGYCHDGCLSMALAYFGAVTSQGGANFASAQASACLCGFPMPTPSMTPTPAPSAGPIPSQSPTPSPIMSPYP